MSAATQEPAAAGVTWDLSALFSGIDDPKIDQTWATMHERADAFAEKYRGKIESGSLSPVELAQAIKELEDITSQGGKPLNFGHHLVAAHTANEEIAAFMQSQMEKSSELRVKLMFFELELLKAPQDYIDSCLGDPA